MNPILKRFEWRERTVHETVDGAEIHSVFYCEPYSAHPLVMSALLGGVDRDAIPPQRILPAKDPYLPHYFCCDVRVEQIDQTSMGGSPGSGYNSIDGPKNFANPSRCMEKLATALNSVPRPDGPNYFAQLGIQISETAVALGSPNAEPPNNADNIKRPMDQAGDNIDYTAGCFITAIYRPVVSALLIHVGTTAGLGEEETRNLSFDAVEPRFEPYSRAVAVEKSLKVLLSGALVWFPSTGTAASVVEHFQHFTIRRLMVPKVPWKTLGYFMNRVNKGPWTPSVGDLSLDLPQLPDRVFPAETLRFVGVDVYDHATSSVRKFHGNRWVVGQEDSILTKDSPFLGPNGEQWPDTILDPRPQRWFDITLHFDWFTTWRPDVHELDGNMHEGWVTWNHRLCEPGLTGGVYYPIGYYRVGWSLKHALNPFKGVDDYRQQYLTTDVFNAFDLLLDLRAE